MTNQEDDLQCIFCRSALKEEGEECELEALPCGHTFHKKCLQQNVSISGKPKRESCPYRCHLSIRNTNTFVDDSDNSEQQEPNQDLVEEDEGRGIDID